MLRHNIARTIFTCKAHILDICPRDKPSQILGKEKHTGIRRAIIFCIKETERSHLLFHSSSFLAIFLYFVIRHCFGQIVMLKLLQIQIVDGRIDAG